MEFLKAILGDDLYAQVEAKINEHNGNDANKEKQIKIGNLGSGEYIAKGKHDNEVSNLKTELEGKITELGTANSLIADFKKNNKDNEEMQNQIKGYETTVSNLQKELAETKIKAAVKVALLSEGASDVDYLTFKLNEKYKEQGKTLELDENENIKGWDNVISELKTQLPNQFETGGSKGNNGEIIIEPNKLPDNQKKSGYTKEELLKKPYSERQAIYNENPEAYKEIMKS